MAIKIILAIVATFACQCQAFVPSMSAQGSNSRQVFLKEAAAAAAVGVAAFGGAATVSAALPDNAPIKDMVKLPEDPDKLPDEFAKNGPGLIEGKPLSPRNKGVAKKLEMRAEDKIAEKNKKGPKSGNVDVAKRIEKGIDNGSAKPLTL